MPEHSAGLCALTSLTRREAFREKGNRHDKNYNERTNVVALEAAPKKVIKISVQYTNHAAGDKKCGSCANFIAESNTCKRVSGTVNPKGGCVLWVKKG